MVGAYTALHKITGETTVRLATFADIPDMVDLGRSFFAVSDMEALAAFCPESLGTSLHGMIQTPDAILLVAEANKRVVGVAGAMTFPAYWNARIRIGQETFWWVTPDYRGEAGPLLLAAMEDEARQRGARTFLMVALEAVRPAAVGKFYERRGYAPLEHSYWKAL